MPLRADRSNFPVSYYWASKWTCEDEKLVSAVIGSAGSQAKWEAYALLLAVKTWLQILRASESQLAFCGDALGVLADALEFRARESIPNKTIAEVALAVAPFGFEISTVHVWSMHNETCDWVSIAVVNEPVPEVLSHATKSTDRRPAWAVLAQ